MTTDYKEVYFSQYILYVQVSLSVISSTSQHGATSLVAKKSKSVDIYRFPSMDYLLASILTEHNKMLIF